MQGKMKAAVLVKPGKIEIQEWDIPIRPKTRRWFGSKRLACAGRMSITMSMEKSVPMWWESQ